MERETALITLSERTAEHDLLHIIAPPGVVITTPCGNNLGTGEYDYPLDRGQHLIISGRGRVCRVFVNDWGLIEVVPINPIIAVDDDIRVVRHRVFGARGWSGLQFGFVTFVTKWGIFPQLGQKLGNFSPLLKSGLLSELGNFSPLR